VGREEGVSGFRLLLLLAAWVGLLAAVIGATLLGARLVFRPWALGHLADLRAVILAEAYVTLLAALLLVFGGPAGLRDRLRFRFTSGLDLAGALGAWFMALVTGVFVSAALTPVIGPPPSNATQLLDQSLDPLFVALVVPTVCVLAPVAEELVFRGALFGWLARHLPVPVSVVITAALFAGAHAIPLLFPALFIFGLAATLVRAHTGSTFNSFAMHATQNTFAVAVFYLTAGLR
jgi:membrane protease YdiL (CAAX protease family)